MKMKRRINVMSKMETDMNIKMKRRTKVVRNRETDSKRMRIKRRRNKNTKKRMDF